MIINEKDKVGEGGGEMKGRVRFVIRKTQVLEDFLDRVFEQNTCRLGSHGQFQV